MEVRRTGIAHPTRRETLRVLTGAAAAMLAAPHVLRGAEAEDLAIILGRSGLSWETGFAVADATTGAVIEAHQPDLDRPPASVVKIVTALWALEVLGPSHRFRTEIRSGGGVVNGRSEGGLVLAGGGNPVLDTDILGDMVGELVGRGVSATTAFAVDGRALPSFSVTEVSQPFHAGYNPALGGINLNFNRVRLAWKPGGEGRPALAMDAPGQRHKVPVASVRAEIGDGRVPTHRLDGTAEVWRIPRSSVGGSGETWLPVRSPESYAADVFTQLAARVGLSLPDPGGPIAGDRALVVRESASLENLMRGMLLHSTNLTAEVAGLAASRARGERTGSLEQSAQAMSAWARDRWGIRRASFANHSGLTVRSMLTPREMVRILVLAPDVESLLPERPILDARGDVLRGPGVRAKTGTMHFLRGYSGFLPASRRRLAFAIFAADPAARSAVDPETGSPPPGAREWSARARAQENALIRRWARLYAA
jgi:D-alanyl-D-alanine carboxypeptidase/D-alanyl-D-alanine-endopeptidase (penicillin-binding protein 4)